ncbi:hypothetical protein ccbrp13_18730 [Ktedonobacteria bacterium brp13]|nr:hypothetical protein ccbrp13_18730 [Ktedonobacteria bacterium brp13]
MDKVGKGTDDTVGIGAFTGNGVVRHQPKHELSTSFHCVDDPASYNEVLYGVPGDDAAKQHRTSSNDR